MKSRHATLAAGAGLLPVLLAAQVLAQDGEKAGEVTFKNATLEDSTGRKVQARFGRLLVPENRSRSDSRLITLAFVQLKSSAEPPGPPLVFLNGGPGEPATPMARSPEALTGWQGALASGDVILLDQRGTGTSRPSLTWPFDKALPRDLFVSRDNFVKAVCEVCTAGAKHLRENGIDLTGYTTAESADDINDLRVALGAEKLNLLGFSYGTHLGLATIQRHGARLANVILVGTEGLAHTRKLPSSYDRQMAQIAELVRADTKVSEHVPDFLALAKRVLDKLEQEPMVVQVQDPVIHQQVEVPVGRFGMQLILVADLGDTNDIPVLPKLLYTVDRGDPTLLRWFVQKRFQQLPRLNAMFWLMDGASGASTERWSRIATEARTAILGNAMNLAFPEVDGVWGTPDLGDEFRAPVVTEVRTLFISGTLDSNTPPAQADEIRRTFRNSTHLIVENAGHEDLLPHPKLRQAVVDFLGGKDVGDVRVSLPRPRFVPIEGHDPAVTHPSVPPPKN